MINGCYYFVFVYKGKNPGLGIRLTWVLNSGFITCCVTLDKSLGLSDLFPHQITTPPPSTIQLK